MIILKVKQVAEHLWHITDERGGHYRTKNIWMASLATKAMEATTDVQIHSSAGWWYRDLTGIVPTVKDTTPLRKVCSLCNAVVSEGRDPTSHTLCPLCQAKMNADMDAKYGVDGDRA